MSDKCKKCSSVDINIQYHRENEHRRSCGHEYTVLDTTEHLHKLCVVCGYDWSTVTNDNIDQTFDVKKIDRPCENCKTNKGECLIMKDRVMSCNEVDSIKMITREFNTNHEENLGTGYKWDFDGYKK